MATVILITDAQAAQLTDPNLVPTPLTSPYNGYTHVQGVEVLSDPTQEASWPVLSGLPTTDLANVASLIPRIVA